VLALLVRERNTRVEEFVVPSSQDLSLGSICVDVLLRVSGLPCCTAAALGTAVVGLNGSARALANRMPFAASAVVIVEARCDGIITARGDDGVTVPEAIAIDGKRGEGASIAPPTAERRGAPI